MTQSISDEVPNGFCKKCGFHLQNTKGKQKICVNCDIQGDQPTDHTNDFGDPGHAAVMASLGSVVSAKERVQTKEPPHIDKAQHIPAVDEGAKAYVGVAKNVQTIPEPLQALEQVQRYFAVLPVTDLKQAKVLLKLRKDIEVLANKITNFLGGK